MPKDARVIIQLECQSCRKSKLPGVSRYTVTKNKKKHPDRIELNKFCPYENKYTLHKEVK